MRKPKAAEWKRGETAIYQQGSARKTGLNGIQPPKESEWALVGIQRQGNARGRLRGEATMDHCISGCRSPSGGMACRTGRSEVGALPLGQECLTPAPASWLCWIVDRRPTLPSVEWKDCEGLRKDPDLISRMQNRGAAHRTQIEMYFFLIATLFTELLTLPCVTFLQKTPCSFLPRHFRSTSESPRA